MLYPPLVNGLQKTLDAQLDEGVTSSVTLNNTTNIQNLPGVFVVSRVDANGNLLPTSQREYIKYTAVSGNTLTGLVRGTGGSTDQDHAVGSIVEFVSDVQQQQEIIDAIEALETDFVVEHNADGTHSDITANSTQTDSLTLASGATVTTILDEDDMSSDSATALATQQSAKAYTDNQIAAIDGWSTYSAVVPTRASADDPTYVLTFAGVDLTTTIYPGMRVKWTQDSTVRYGIVTKMAFSTDTTMTIYGGTDYDVADTASLAISDFAYSTHKAPAGFPLDPSKWTVQVKSTSDITGSYTTWTSSGVSIDIPIGIWETYYELGLYASAESGGGAADIQSACTLSTTTNSEEDNDFTSYVEKAGSTSTSRIQATVGRRKTINLTNKDTYYLLINSFSASDNVHIRGGDQPTIIRAVCAYL